MKMNKFLSEQFRFKTVLFFIFYIFQNERIANKHLYGLKSLEIIYLYFRGAVCDQL